MCGTHLKSSCNFCIAVFPKGSNRIITHHLVIGKLCINTVTSFDIATLKLDPSAILSELHVNRAWNRVFGQLLSHAYRGLKNNKSQKETQTGRAGRFALPKHENSIFHMNQEPIYTIHKCQFLWSF